ncbi:hypothetical protein [Tenacibaculum ovolyticum]|uniref:hypothetical protein n=1 Tax=Tenacibaculum ovolyticum TaxID=104270 RepID=UPI0007EC89F9|nr:hypothetical protein [Tenacibaculum ovolyticum]
MGLDLGICRAVLVDNKINVIEWLNFLDAPSNKINRAFVFEIEKEILEEKNELPHECDTFRPVDVEKAIKWVERNIDKEKDKNIYISFLNVLEKMKDDKELHFYEV